MVWPLTWKKEAKQTKNETKMAAAKTPTRGFTMQEDDAMMATSIFYLQFFSPKLLHKKNPNEFLLWSFWMLWSQITMETTLEALG